MSITPGLAAGGADAMANMAASDAVNTAINNMNAMIKLKKKGQDNAIGII